MSSKETENDRDKARILQDLKEAREQALKMAQLTAELRTQKSPRKDLHKDEWTPEKNKTKKYNKKSEGKTKKSKKKQRHLNSDNESDYDSHRDKQRKVSKKEKRAKSSKDPKSSETIKERKQEKRKKRKLSGTETSSSESDEWVESVYEAQTRPQSVSVWMADGFTLKTFSNVKNRDDNENSKRETYNPTQDKRELNKYWKTTGTGLPATFRKPKDNDEEAHSVRSHKQEGVGSRFNGRRNWEKKPHKSERDNNREREITVELQGKSVEKKKQIETVRDAEGGKYFTDQELNELGAKIVKAELLGNIDLAKALQGKLEEARNQRERFKGLQKEALFVKEERLASVKKANPMNCNELYGGRSGRKKAKQKSTTEIEPHINFMDEKYDIKEMFQREKYSSTTTVYKNDRNASVDERDEDTLNYSKLNNCDKCLNAIRMDKKSIISIGEKTYLSLPWHIGLQPGHCVLAPIEHISCSTLLDEDVWEEITNFRNVLTEMYAAQKKDVIFFEIAKNCHSNAHLNIHCVPICHSEAELAPFYFKKAIEEAEHEWSINKQLIKLQNKSLRSSIPKGVPYFWVNFGMTNGFAHVIEDQECFPSNFAQKIIGGFLNLDPQKWRRPQKEHNMMAKVKMFGDLWKKYDFTNTGKKQPEI